MKRWVLLVALASGCPGKQTSAPTGTGSQQSTNVPPSGSAKTCADVKPKVEALYRAEAEAKEPKRVAAAVADNTAMVMNDCNKDPVKAVPCLVSVQSISELEQQCLVPLDDEGTEGESR